MEGVCTSKKSDWVAQKRANKRFAMEIVSRSRAAARLRPLTASEQARLAVPRCKLDPIAETNQRAHSTGDRGRHHRGPVVLLPGRRGIAPSDRERRHRSGAHTYVRPRVLNSNGSLSCRLAYAPLYATPAFRLCLSQSSFVACLAASQLRSSRCYSAS